MSITVHLERFEGPLGLLLHLIRQQEMDIFNINVNEITRQYLEYIKSMRKLDLEVAGEFVAMAATLLQIKSRMLLPQYDEDGEAIITEDPRKELVDKLIEYQMFQDASKQLYKRPLLGRDVWSRGDYDDIVPNVEGEVIVEENPLFSLISAYRVVLKSMKKTYHRVLGELQSISERIMEIRDRLIVGQRVRMGDLITDTGHGSNQVLVTFLSMLELAKMGFVSLFQAENFADIHIDTKRNIDRDIVSQVEDYSAVNATAIADSIMSQAQLSLTEVQMTEDSEEAIAAGYIAVENPAVESLESNPDAATDEEIVAEEARLFAESNAVEGDTNGEV
jgi:segregation and condensation protein A